MRLSRSQYIAIIASLVMVLVLNIFPGCAMRRGPADLNRMDAAFIKGSQVKYPFWLEKINQLENTRGKLACKVLRVIKTGPWELRDEVYQDHIARPIQTETTCGPRRYYACIFGRKERSFWSGQKTIFDGPSYIGINVVNDEYSPDCKAVRNGVGFWRSPSVNPSLPNKIK